MAGSWGRSRNEDEYQAGRGSVESEVPRATLWDGVRTGGAAKKSTRHRGAASPKRGAPVSQAASTAPGSIGLADDLKGHDGPRADHLWIDRVELRDGGVASCQQGAPVRLREGEGDAQDERVPCDDER